MHLVRSQPVRNASCIVFPADAVVASPKSHLRIVDGLVSVTQQYWAASHHCANGFSGDAA